LIVSLLYRTARALLSIPAVLLRRDAAKEFLTAQAQGIIAADFFHVHTALG